MKAVLFMFVIFALSFNIDNCYAASKRIAPLTSWHVTIKNSQPTTALVVHCKSKDNDLGKQFTKLLLRSFFFFSFL